MPPLRHRGSAPAGLRIIGNHTTDPDLSTLSSGIAKIEHNRAFRGMTQDADGVLLVSDDHAGIIYFITYKNKDIRSGN